MLRILGSENTGVPDMTDANIDANYAAGGFGESLEWGTKPAVIVVDLCVAYLQEGSPLFADAEPARASAERIVDAARSRNVPVIFTRVEFEPGGADGGLFFKKVKALRSFERGNPLGDFPSAPRPLPGEIVVTKQYASAFFATSLASTMNAMRLDTAIVTGVSTSGCVRATALDALQHGFVPLVVRDAVGDRHRAPHEANLFDLQAKYADVISEVQCMEYLKSL
jgi:maleamate amidohydrolase